MTPDPTGPRTIWDLPWGKIIPLVALLLGAGGGVGGSFLNQSQVDAERADAEARSREARRAGWQALSQQRDALLQSHIALRQACEDGLEEKAAREDALVERLLACGCVQ